VNKTSSSWSRPFTLILATIVLLRLLTLQVPDLVDTTEGRYATTAQIMVERNDWVTPWIIYQGKEEPYLGKPPLHFWLINTSYSLFGVSNFSARLPGVFSGAAIAAILFFLTQALLSRQAAYVAALVFSTSTLAFFLSGAVLLDVTLTVGITLAIAGFALADRGKLYGHLFFAGLGLGILVKGPAAVVFAGAALGPWVLVRGGINPRNWPAQVKTLPWVTGIALLLAIVTPWYIWAEIRNPGFLKYFIWTENVGRFFSKEYADQYGSGHVQPRATAWLMFILCVVPWSFVLVSSMIESAKKHSLRSLSAKNFIARLKEDQWLLLGFTWAISCPLLLTGMTQYTATYIMSSMPGFAFFMAVWWQRAFERGTDASFPSPIVTRIICGLLGVVAAASACVFFAIFEIHMWAFALALGFGVALTLEALVRRTQVNSLKAIGRIALCTVVLYAVLFPCADIQISKTRSTKEILKFAEDLVGYKKYPELKIGFAFNQPFSSRFYSSLRNKDSDQKIVISQIAPARIINPAEHLIIVKGKGAEKELLTIDPNKQKLGQMGKWKVYKGAPLP
jgi:4-amino-4-deoxy-L-arabinose transferase-like glycosyltransferase